MRSISSEPCPHRTFRFENPSTCPRGRSTLNRALLVFGCCCLAALLVVVGLDWYGRSCRRSGAVGDVTQPPTKRLVVETPIEAYHIWKSSGYHGRKLLYLSGGWQQITPSDILPKLDYSPYPLRLFSVVDAMERDNLSDGSVLFIASYRGILREVRAVLPAAAYAEREQKARSSKTGSIGTGEVMITYQGQARYFTTLRVIPDGGEPPLVLVTADFMAVHSPEEVMRYLAGVRTDCVLLCIDRNNPAVGDLERKRLTTLARLLGITSPAASQRAS